LSSLSTVFLSSLIRGYFLVLDTSLLRTKAVSCFSPRVSRSSILRRTCSHQRLIVLRARGSMQQVPVPAWRRLRSRLVGEKGGCVCSTAAAKHYGARLREQRAQTLGCRCHFLVEIEATASKAPIAKLPMMALIIDGVRPFQVVLMVSPMTSVSCRELLHQHCLNLLVVTLPASTCADGCRSTLGFVTHSYRCHRQAPLLSVLEIICQGQSSRTWLQWLAFTLHLISRPDSAVTSSHSRTRTLGITKR